MAKFKCPPQNPKGLPAYMGTMADMFTLLFAFFVLLFSMSTLDYDPNPIIKEYEKLLIDCLDDICSQIDLEEDCPIIYHDPRGLVFELKGELWFKPLQAEFEPKLAEYLDYGAECLQMAPDDKRQIIVEGHTDNQIIPEKFQKYYPTNWELSSARSSRIVRYLIEKNVNPARLIAHGYADRWPYRISWEVMRRGYLYKYDESYPLSQTPLSKRIYMDAIIDSLNENEELRKENRRIKIIITRRNYIDGDKDDLFDDNYSKFAQQNDSN